MIPPVVIWLFSVTHLSRASHEFVLVVPFTNVWCVSAADQSRAIDRCFSSCCLFGRFREYERSSSASWTFEEVRRLEARKSLESRDCLQLRLFCLSVSDKCLKGVTLPWEDRVDRILMDLCTLNLSFRAVEFYMLMKWLQGLRALCSMSLRTHCG